MQKEEIGAVTAFSEVHLQDAAMKLRFFQLTDNLNLNGNILFVLNV